MRIIKQDAGSYDEQSEIVRNMNDWAIRTEAYMQQNLTKVLRDIKGRRQTLGYQREMFDGNCTLPFVYSYGSARVLLAAWRNISGSASGADAVTAALPA